MSGTSITARNMLPDSRIFGTEPVGADDAARSLSARKFIPQENPNTICDGLLTSMGKTTWPIIEIMLRKFSRLKIGMLKGQ